MKLAIFHMLPSGGGIRVVRQFAEGLSEFFALEVYHPFGGNPLNTGKPIPERVIPFPMWRRPAGVLRPVAPLFLLFRLLSFKSVCRKAADIMNKEADAALVHNTMPVAAPPVFQYLAIPSIYFCYEYPRHIYEKDIISRTGSRSGDLALKPLEITEKKMDYRSAKAAGRILTFSSYMRQSVKSIYGLDSSIVRPGVDSSFFTPAQTGKKGNFVLSVGALWPFKGHETAIRILSGIPPSSRPSLKILGDREFPGYSDELLSLAGSIGVKVSIARQVTNERLRELYRQASLVLCCQRREPYGLVPLEAMACGTPVLAISEGGYVDNIVHEETGLLFDGSVRAGTSELKTILDDGVRCDKLAERGLDFVRSLRTVESGVTQLAEELRRL